MPKIAEELLDLAFHGGRVCPRPSHWSRLHQMLAKAAAPGEPPSPPLILAAWGFTSDFEKADRFRAHLQFATDAGLEGRVLEFLQSLPPSEWHHFGE